MEQYFAKLAKVNENSRILTHTDLDGAGAAVLLKSFFRDGVDVIHCPNDMMSRMIRDKASDPDTAKEYDLMIVSDISCSEEDAEYVDKHKQVALVLLDHHQTAVGLNRFSWACVQPLLLKGSYRDSILYETGAVSVHSSGTSLVYDYMEYCGLTRKFRNPELAKRFGYRIHGEVLTSTPTRTLSCCSSQKTKRNIFLKKKWRTGSAGETPPFVDEPTHSHTAI